ncbi:MAG TPA: sulfatase-like hydrolase/transferase [Polyangiaceae bacterium]|nr:sulfatase-like hydrolase/transferase [Polyangiaceae bacterium]
MSKPAVEKTRRLLASLVAASAATAVVSVADSHFARSAASEPLSGTSLWLTGAGITWPVLFMLGLAVGAASLFLHPSAAPSVSRLRSQIQALDAEARARLGVSVVLGALGFVMWTALTAIWATRLLALDAGGGVVGAALGLSAVLAALLLSGATLGLASSVAKRAAERVPSVAVCAGLAAVVVIGFFVAAISSGTTSGSGGPLAIFGVFKRPELDLRAPGLVLLSAAVCYALPAYLLRVPGLVLALVAVAPIGLTLRSAGQAMQERRLALALERDAPLARMVLPRLRKLTDGDRDGFAARFGGGDCDDSKPEINPGAEDVPENSLDEDCSGADAKKVTLQTEEKPAPKDAGAWVAQHLPQDLNVLLITIDTLRFDLGFMGYARPVSRNLDRLAKVSAVFENSYALASYTSKSLPPMLIGKYPSETHRGWSHFNRFGKEDTFIAERLQQAGLRTVSVQSYWYFFQKGVGFERGFDVVNTDAAPKAIQMEGDRTVSADKLTDAAIAELSKPEMTKKPFFAWVHYVDPHAEYVRHEKHDFGSASRDAYDSEVAFVDEHVGRLLDMVQQGPLGKKTAVIVTSDHGEAFGEHGMIRHGFEIWEELVRVPFIVHVPGATPRRVSEARSIIDVVPTVLDLLRLPHPKGEGFDFISGKSLLFDVMGPPGHSPAKRIVFVDMSAGPNNGERQAFIEGGMKLTASGGRPTALYDLNSDPAEKKDLLDDKEKSGPLIDRYKAFRRELREVKVRPVPK